MVLEPLVRERPKHLFVTVPEARYLAFQAGLERCQPLHAAVAPETGGKAVEVPCGRATEKGILPPVTGRAETRGDPLRAKSLKDLREPSFFYWGDLRHMFLVGSGHEETVAARALTQGQRTRQGVNVSLMKKGREHEPDTGAWAFLIWSVTAVNMERDSGAAGRAGTGRRMGPA